MENNNQSVTGAQNNQILFDRSPITHGSHVQFDRQANSNSQIGQTFDRNLYNKQINPTTVQSNQTIFERSQTSTHGSLISLKKTGDNFKCSLCNKEFGYKNGLIRHVRLTHDKERPFQCNICHRRFGYKNILLEHQNIHFGIKPYACNLCDKKFAARSNLVQHRLIHRKPFCCYMCNKRFDKEAQLQRHLLTCQGEALQCSICNYAAANQASLNKHIFEAHPPQFYDTRDRNRLGMETATSEDMQINNGQNIPSSSGESLMVYNIHTNTESESMRKIDNICSQLATRSNSTTPSDTVSANINIKQENPSPMYDSQPIFPVAVTAAGDKNTDNQVFRSILVHSQSIPMNQPSTLDELVEVINDRSTPENPASTRLHIMPSPRNQDHVNATADSTSSLSEMLSVLQSLVQKSSELPTNSSSVSVTITPPKSLKNVATQYSCHMDGMPTLDEAIAFYVSQGKLYKCQYCGILFQERGMFFLHNSLHSTSNPWECSICHKACADKNDFNLHFVNQQHD